MLVYDCEIVNAIQGNEPKKLGINYCKGWEDHAGMGISVTCVYDCERDRYRVFCKDNMDEFQALVHQNDLLVGFNSIRFDNRLLRANRIEIDDSHCYDLLAAIWVGSGLTPTWGGFSTHGGFSLDDTAALNLGHKKTGNGALAPVLWQEGRIGTVIDYCLEDVRLTVQLLDRVIESGMLMSPKTHKPIKVRRPV